MTDTAVQPTDALTPYAGQQVAKTTITIKNAGDGLSKGMAIDPQELPLRSTQYVVLECAVIEHQHGPLEGTDLLVLDQVLKAGNAALVPADLVAGVLAEAAERIEEARKAKELAKEAAKGTRRFLTDEQVAELQAEHDEGKHDGDLGLREGCPGCEERLAEQAAAKAAEEADAAGKSGRRRRGQG